MKADGPRSGGMDTFYRGALSAIARSGAFERVLWFGSTPPDDLTDVDVVGVPSVSLGARVLTDQHRYDQILRSHPVDTLLCAGNEAVRNDRATSVFLPMTVAPYAPTVARSLWGRSGVARAAAMRALIRRSMRRADLTVFSSVHASRTIDARGKARAAVVVPPAGALPVTGLDTPPPEARERLVLAVSHLYPYKRVVEAVRGFAQYQSLTDRHARLVVAGATPDDDYHRAVLRTAEELGVADAVEIVGRLDMDRLTELYQAAGALLFTSEAENAGSYVLYEAMATGLPIVSGDDSSIPEVCGDAARYCDVTDPASIAEAIHDVLDEPQHAAELARRGLARVRANGGWDRWVSDLLDVLGVTSGN